MFSIHMTLLKYFKTNVKQLGRDVSTRAHQECLGKHFFIEKLLIISKWETCWILATYQTSGCQLYYVVSELIYSSIMFSLSVVLWNGCVELNNMFTSSSARKLERRPQEMNHGFMATTPRQNKCCHNGIRRRHLGWRMRGKFGQTSRQCWSLSLTGRVWCITSFFPKTRPWIKLSIKTFFSAFKKQCVGNGLTNCLPIHGFCTTTMCHVTRLRVSENSSPSTASPWFLARLTRFGPSSPGWRAPCRQTISRRHEDSTKYEMAPVWHSQTRLPARHTFKSETIAGITEYNLGDRTLKEITSSNL